MLLQESITTHNIYAVKCLRIFARRYGEAYLIFNLHSMLRTRQALLPSLLLAPLCFLTPSDLAAQGFANAKYAGEFLALGVGARSSALGGAGTGFAGDVTAGYFNPAALISINHPQISIFHESRFGGLTNYDYAGAAIPFGTNQSIGLSAFRLGYGDDIPITLNALMDNNDDGEIDEDERLDPAKITYGSASDWAVFASYAREIDDKLSVGGNVKVLYRALLDNSAWGLGFDLSASYRPIEGLSLGAVLSDATKSMLAWDTGNQEFIVPALRLGAAYKYRVDENHSFMPVVDGTFRFEGRHKTAMVDLGIASLDAQAGLEYSYKDKFFVRGGVNDLKQLSVGAGVRLPKLNIDYSFTNENTQLSGFGATHRISLMLTLEEPKFAREGVSDGK